jgi:hypothetical protein
MHIYKSSLLKINKLILFGIVEYRNRTNIDVGMLLPVRLVAYCSIMEADECGRITYLFKSGAESLRTYFIQFKCIFDYVCTHVYWFTYINSGTKFMSTCSVLNANSPMYIYYTDLRGSTTANQSKATQSDNLVPFTKM